LAVIGPPPLSSLSILWLQAAAAAAAEGVLVVELVD
jgi:hypothetical protein